MPIAIATALSWSIAAADVVTDWHETAAATLAAAGARPAVETRAMAMMHVAMFDAVNAIGQRYASFHVSPSDVAAFVLDETSRRAAAARAAYTVLVNVPLLPASLKPALDAKLAASLEAIATDPDHDGFSCFDPGGEKGAGRNDLAVANGVALGQAVGLDIVAWRSTDGLRTAQFLPVFLVSHRKHKSDDLP